MVKYTVVPLENGFASPGEKVAGGSCTQVPGNPGSTETVGLMVKAAGIAPAGLAVAGVAPVDTAHVEGTAGADLPGDLSGDQYTPGVGNLRTVPGTWGPWMVRLPGCGSGQAR
jgi:hypothetical protein